jgi:phage terminase small subunit
MPRRPQPSATLKLHGSRNAGRRKEHVAESGELVPTAGVAAWPLALAFFEHYRRWSPAGLLKPVDSALLSRLALSLAIGETAALAIAERGPFADKPRKGAQSMMAVLRAQTDLARQLCSELGLSPIGRVRAAAPDAPGTDRSTRSGCYGDPRLPARGVKPEPDEPGSSLETFLSVSPRRTVQ